MQLWGQEEVARDWAASGKKVAILASLGIDFVCLFSFLSSSSFFFFWGRCQTREFHYNVDDDDQTHSRALLSAMWYDDDDVRRAPYSLFLFTWADSDGKRRRRRRRRPPRGQKKLAFCVCVCLSIIQLIVGCSSQHGPKGEGLPNTLRGIFFLLFSSGRCLSAIFSPEEE